MNANNQLLFTACATCGQRVTSDSIHTCSPQLKELTDEEILQVHSQMMEDSKSQLPPYVDFARAILRKAQEK